MNANVKKGIRLFIYALVIILVLSVIGGYVFAAFLKGEQVTKIDKALLFNAFCNAVQE